LYVVFKLDTLEIVYSTNDYLGLLTSYNYTDPDTNEVTARVRITLPIINTIQEKLIDGTWKLGLYNHREAQRQSLSKALRPKADLLCNFFTMHKFDDT